MSLFTSSNDKLKDSNLSTLKTIHATTLREISNLEKEIPKLNDELSVKNQKYVRELWDSYNIEDGRMSPDQIKKRLDPIRDEIDTITKKQNSQTSKLNEFRKRLQEVEGLISEKEKEKERETRFLNTGLKLSLNNSIGNDNANKVFSYFNDNSISLGDNYPYKKRKCEDPNSRECIISGGKTRRRKYSKKRKCSKKRKYSKKIR